MADTDAVREAIQRYRQDPESVYNTWFTHGEERLKAFRTIRRGVMDVVTQIRDGSFPNDFRGSALETVLAAITEQKQVFQGAAHAFYWKPKLRIPDIYENRENQLAFGRFLDACLRASREEQLLAEIHRLDPLKIKGLGPAVANILYFLHPTLLSPSNTAMVNGFAALFGGNPKLGSWTDYLAMRATILEVNAAHQSLLSKDLGAIAGLLFEVGVGRLAMPGNAETAVEFEAKRQKVITARHQEMASDAAEESQHTAMQAHLVTIGRALGYDVWVARNDRQREWEGRALGEHCLRMLPAYGLPADVSQTIELIDVLWLDRNIGAVQCAFEVEKSTSIYSGILRLHDLALALADHDCHLFLVAPEKREKEVVAQLQRPALRQSGRQRIAYILFEMLAAECAALCRYGDDRGILSKIAHSV
ncbi:MAG: hypothetical protein HY321_15270 [Armatimonadetes bacterium]|nr:hypothetical protein [Armatimonadota bacterium]